MKRNNSEIRINSIYNERGFSLRFVEDVAGSIYDIFKFIIRSISYLLVGMIIVAVPLYLIVWIVGVFQ